jgi:methionyl-tRNA formyltransferase
MRNVLLIGMGPTAPSALQSLAERCRVVGVVRKVEARDAAADPVVAAAQPLGIPVFVDSSIAALRDLIRRLHPDCVVISSFDRILPADLIDSCPFVNVHYAPLPRYRGRATVNWAVISGEPFTAITIHVVDHGLDTGNVLFQHPVAIDRDDTVGDLYDRLNQLQRQHLGDTVVSFLDGDVGVPQAAEPPTYGCTRLPADGEIDWSAPTENVAALIRGLDKPYPGAFTYLNTRRLVIWRARALDAPLDYRGRVPGRIVNVSRTEGHVDVLTGDGVLRIYEVEVEPDGRVRAAAVLRSVRETLGLRPAELLSRIEALEREIAWLREQALSGEKHAHI